LFSAMAACTAGKSNMGSASWNESESEPIRRGEEEEIHPVAL
jgi:hypothetical protein